MAAQQTNITIAVDPDIDSALGVSLEEQPSLTSLSSSVRQYHIENGRSYHSLSAGKYMFPNDEGEADRLDFQHEQFLLTLGGELCLAPDTKKAQRVLDIGTGTGVWAMDFADANPQAEVIGVDLSPIQPSFVPSNCTFEIDDLDKEWMWSKPFDFIFSRMMTGSFQSPDEIAKKAFTALSPNGWYELQDIDVNFFCDDNTLPADSALGAWTKACNNAAAKIGREYGGANLYKSRLEKTGFVDVEEKIFLWPMNSWPKDPKLKEMGKLQFANLSAGLEALSMAFLTRALGWREEEVRVLCAKVKGELANLRYHVYWKVYVVYGRKPEE